MNVEHLGRLKAMADPTQKTWDLSAKDQAAIQWAVGLIESTWTELRDYFAIHCDQPGRLEIATLAGVETLETSSLPWGNPERKGLPTWESWFNALPQEERFRMYATIRYQIADAMLKAREEKTP